MLKLYTLDNQFIREIEWRPKNFTGIVSMGNGSKFWYLNGKQHRIDGPAIILHDGSSTRWFLNDKLHRIDGPAIEYRVGIKEWWLDDKEVTMEQHKLYVDIMKLKGLL